MAKKILIIEDDRKMASFLGMRLKANGFAVVTAADGKSGLEKARRVKPDLIILDVLMPKMHGFEVSRRIKKDSRTRHIPVIMLTALAEEKDVAKGLKIGVECFITKPFSAGDLLGEIQQALGERSAQV